MTRSDIIQLKAVLSPAVACAAIVLVFVWCFLERWKVKSKIPWAVLGVVLLGGAILSVAIYFELGHFRYDRYINPHDTFHYYMGSKYSPELGYSHLYSSALVADMTEGRRLYSAKSTIRDQGNYRYVAVRTVLKDAQKYRALFSDERWDEFKKDIAFFQSIMPRQKWNRVLRDKGYNATPVWNMVARSLTNAYSTDSWWFVCYLLGLDLMLVAIMFVLIYAAFGWNAMALAVIFFGVNFFMTFVHIKGAILRLDWVTMLVMAVCMLKLGRYKTAGAMASYATLARVFPAIFLFGMGSKLVWEFFRTRKINRRYVEFFATFVIVAAVLVGASIVNDGDLHLWREFKEKISLHNNDLSSTRVGFKYIFLDTSRAEGSWFSYVEKKQQEFAERKVSWWAIQAAVLLVSFFAVRNLTAHEALAYGIVPAFFLIAPTFYYYVMLIVPFMFFAARIESIPRAIGLAWLFGVSIAAYFFYRKYQLSLHQFYIVSWILMSFVAYTAFAALITTRAAAEQEAPQLVASQEEDQEEEA